MIIVSARIFGIALGSWKIRLGIDLPVEDYKTHLGVLEIEVTLGPKDGPAPAHAEDMTRAVEPNTHAEPPAEVTASLDNWS